MIGHHGIAAFILQFCLGAISGRGSPCKIANPLFSQILQRGCQASNSAAQPHLLWNNVKRRRGCFKRGDRHNQLPDWIRISADNRLQRQNDMAGHQSGIHRDIGLGRVPAAAFNGQFEHIRGCKKRTRANGEFSGRHLWPIMHAIDLLDPKTLHQTIFTHFTATTAAFFCRLKNHHCSAVKIPSLG